MDDWTSSKTWRLYVAVGILGVIAIALAVRLCLVPVRAIKLNYYVQTETLAEGC
jgi:anti-sigma-K factor RskA